MLKKLIKGYKGRAARLIVGFLLAKLILVPFIAQMPGASEFLISPESQEYLAAGLIIAGASLAKLLRDKGIISAKIPL